MTIVSLGGIAGLVLPPLGYVLALAAHRAGRSTRVPLGLVAAGLGLPTGFWMVTGFAYLAAVLGSSVEGVIATIVGLVAVPSTVVAMARRGARREAGAFLAAVALGWLVAANESLVGLFRTSPGAASLEGTIDIAGIVALVVGIALLILADPAADPASPEVQARRRRMGAFGAAIMGRARLGPATPALVATIVAIAAVSLAPDRSLSGLPAILLAVLVAVIAAELELRLVPPRVRPALEAFHWIGRGAMARFASATGRPVPTTKRDATAWLATPETDADREFRPELLVWLGRPADALEVVARMPEHTAAERFQKALEADFVGWSQTGSPGHAHLAALAREIDDATERLRAEGLIAWRDSQHAFAAGDPDWLAPLAAFRARLGAEADGLHPRAMRSVTQIPVVGVALLLSAAIQYGPEIL